MRVCLYYYKIQHLLRLVTVTTLPLANYSAMNNAKWREIIPILAGKVTPIQISLDCTLMRVGIKTVSRFAHIFKGNPMKTYNATNETATHNWYTVDASGQTLGRLATEVARRLRGKHKPEYTPNVDTGDYIVVINASQIKITGNKSKDKVYYSHSGYPGGIKAITFEKLLAKQPEKVIEKAVKGMLPKNPLGRAMYRKLKVYAGAEHPHTAQQPQVLDLQKETE